jgi:chromosome partitioning protein
MNHHPHSIAFVHHKGGTGKTTACINIAGYLVKMGKKVLIVDLDPQANATAGLGIDRRSIDYSLYDVFFNNRAFQEIILESDSGVHIAPSSIDLLAAEMHMAEFSNPTRVLRTCLANIGDYYDYILLDVPPGSTMLMMNGIIAADDLIVPIDAGIFGVETMETLRILLRHIQDELGVESNIMLILLREYPANLFGKNPTKDLRSLLHDFLHKDRQSQAKIFTIPYSAAVYMAQMKGVPISHYKGYSDVGRVFKKIAKEILVRHGDLKFDDGDDKEKPMSKDIER